MINLWEGTYVLNDQRQYLRVGLKSLISSPEINNYFKTLEKAISNKDERMSLQALQAVINTVKRHTASTYDKNVQTLPYIIPNIQLHKLRTKRHYDKNVPFGEKN